VSVLRSSSLLSALGILFLLVGWQFSSLTPTGSVLAAEDCEQYQCDKDNQDEDGYLQCISDKSQCLKDKIAETQTQAITLNNTISILNGQIQVQELQISQTLAEISQLERQIEELTVRISGLEISLDRLSTLLVERVNKNYKRHSAMPLSLLLISDSLGDFLSQYKYLQLTQRHLGEVMAKAEEQRLDYDQQKALKEDKQDEVEQKRLALQSQQNQLTGQRADHQILLSQTKSNEARYQAELAKTLAELEAIQSIIAGRGDETEVGPVSEGDKIATIIAGASPCSTGSHLHFEVVKDNAHRDPAGYLKSIDAVWNNDPDGAFGLSGGWDWPVNNPAKINQGYGMTYYARVRRAYGGAPHTGIDMFSKSAGDFGVKSVKEGTLSRGSIACGGGLLKYVKVEHKDDGIDTYYLHVNY
jgi:peptidoglycan hydrolase CwlO-like protein